MILKENFEKVAICTFSKTSVMLDCFSKPVPKQIIPAVLELTTCFRYTSRILLVHLVWGQLICSKQYLLIGPTFILLCLVLINVLSYVQRSVGMSYRVSSGFFSLFVWFFFPFFPPKKDVSVELVRRPKSCCVSSIMLVSPLVHRFWKPPFQKSWQSGLSEALERFQYLFYLKQGHKKQLGIKYSWTDEIHSLFAPK